MNKLLVFFKSILINVRFSIKTCFLASKKYFTMKCLALLFTTLIPLLTIWLWKEVLNRLSGHDGSYHEIFVYLSVYFFLKLFTYLSSHVESYIGTRYSDELEFYIESVMIDKISRIDLSYFDSANMSDKAYHARDNFGVMTQVAELVFDLISGAINIVYTILIVTAYKWWIGLMTIVLLIPFMLYNKSHIDKLLQMEKEQIREERKKDFFSGTFYDNNIQFEIKLNHIGDRFLQQFKEIWTKLYKINKKEDMKHQIVAALIMLLNMVSELVVLVVSGVDVINQRIGIGDLQYHLSMVSRLREQTQGFMNNIDRLFVDNTRLIELQEFINIIPEVEKSGSRIPSDNPKIEFSHVFFQYPNTEQYVLKDCSFTIQPHEKVGLIGLNGSGKSTIVKLMFRFYDPQQGCILLDGVNIKEYDIYAVRKVFGVLFQDYVTYCLPLREIIALSDFEERFNDEKLKKACDLSGVSQVIKDWDMGFDSVLGRYYADNGRDLSGGQWQLVGLARAYFKECEFIVLDEPSAALDPISEDRIFEQLYYLSKGKSAVTISHRLSNTTLADKIFVIGDGHIIEQGTHTELLKQNGEYARLFHLQASKYL